MENPARFKVVACGRRWGKTELGVTSILNAALHQNKRCWWLAPTRQMASQVWRDLKRAVKTLKGTCISETERRIDLAGGGMIAVRSAHHPDNLRGEGLDFRRARRSRFHGPPPLDRNHPSHARHHPRRRPALEHAQRTQLVLRPLSPRQRSPDRPNGSPSTFPAPTTPSSSPPNWTTFSNSHRNTSGRPNTKPISPMTADKSSAASPTPSPPNNSTIPNQAIPTSPASIGDAIMTTPPSPLSTSPTPE